LDQQQIVVDNKWSSAPRDSRSGPELRSRREDAGYRTDPGSFLAGSDLASSFLTTDQNGNPVPTTVSGPYFGSQLSQKLSYGVSIGEPYYFAGCTSSTQCVLPNASIPTTAWWAPATKLLKYIPAPNNSNGTFSTSSYDQTLQDDKGAYKLDGTTRWGMLSAYYFQDGWTQNNPYPMAQGGANVPGFNALNSGRAQLLALGDTKTSARLRSTNFISASCAMRRTSDISSDASASVSLPRDS
jgi:hypothetical protein